MKQFLVLVFLFICLSVYSQTDSTTVTRDSTVIPLGEKFDTITFKGILLENPLVVKEYRQIVKSRYFMAAGRPQQEYIDSWIETKRRKGWMRIVANPEDFMFTKKM